MFFVYAFLNLPQGFASARPPQLYAKASFAQICRDKFGSNDVLRLFIRRRADFLHGLASVGREG